MAKKDIFRFDNSNSKIIKKQVILFILIYFWYVLKNKDGAQNMPFLTSSPALLLQEKGALIKKFTYKLKEIQPRRNSPLLKEKGRGWCELQVIVLSRKQ